MVHYRCIREGHSLTSTDRGAASSAPGSINHFLAKLEGGHTVWWLALLLITCTFVYDPAAQAEPLEGRVEEGNSLSTSRLPFQQWRDQILPNLKAGAQWSDACLPAMGDFYWYQVPAELAGGWHCEHATIRQVAPIVGRADKDINRFDLTYGCQLDSRKQIWTAVRLPSITRVEGKGMVSYNIWIGFEASLMERGVLERKDSVQVWVSKSSGKIVGVFRRQDEEETTAISGDALERKEKTTNETNGRRYEGVAQLQRTAPFSPVDVGTDGADMRAAFKEFLLSHNLGNLIPEDRR